MVYTEKVVDSSGAAAGQTLREGREHLPAAGIASLSFSGHKTFGWSLVTERIFRWATSGLSTLIFNRFCRSVGSPSAS